MVRVLLIALPLMFIGNSHLCDLLYIPGSLEWWKLRTNIYSLMFAGLFYLVRRELKEKPWRFVIGVTVGLCLSDVVDRIMFNTREFTKEDYIMIFITLVVSYYETYRKK